MKLVPYWRSLVQAADRALSSENCCRVDFPQNRVDITGMNLEAWLRVLEQRHPKSIDLGLERCGAVYRRLGSPRPAKRVFTVAGTNGKGSTVAYLAAMSGGLGQRYGTYTSPHIFRFNERISIMGVPVSDECLVRAFEQVEAARDQVTLTYFEFTTLAGC